MTFGLVSPNFKLFQPLLAASRVCALSRWLFVNLYTENIAEHFLMDCLSRCLQSMSDNEFIFDHWPFSSVGVHTGVVHRPLAAYAGIALLNYSTGHSRQFACRLQERVSYRYVCGMGLCMDCVNVGWPAHRLCCLSTYWLFGGTLTLIRVMSTVLLWHFVHYPKWGVGNIPFIVIINRKSRLVHSYLSCGGSQPCIIASIGGRCLSSLKLTLSISISRWTFQPCTGYTN